MDIPTIVLVTGHPGTGKTTLAEALAQELKLPLTCRDQFKETLLDTLGWSTEEWANSFRLLQIRCETSAEVLIARYHERIANGTRHPGHIDRSEDAAFLDLIHQGPMDWIDVESEQLAVDTNVLDQENYQTVAMAVRRFMLLA